MKIFISKSGPTSPVMMLTALRDKLENLNVPPDVIHALSLAMDASNQIGNAAQAYAGGVYEAVDSYGLEGLKTQILYLLPNMSRWQGESARVCKRVLTRFAQK